MIFCQLPFILQPFKSLLLRVTLLTSFPVESYPLKIVNVLRLVRTKLSQTRESPHLGESEAFLPFPSCRFQSKFESHLMYTFILLYYLRDKPALFLAICL